MFMGIAGFAASLILAMRQRFAKLSADILSNDPSEPELTPANTANYETNHSKHSSPPRLFRP